MVGVIENVYEDYLILLDTVCTQFVLKVILGICTPRISRGGGGGWSGGAMVLSKLPVPGRPTILITVGQGPIAHAVGAGGGGLDIFTLIYPFFSFSHLQ